MCEFQEKLNERSQFTGLVAFLERQVRLVSDPVYLEIQDMYGQRCVGILELVLGW